MTIRDVALGRRFVVWSYTPTHSTFLLMSTREFGYDTRVCLLFEGVEFLSIATDFICDNFAQGEGSMPRIYYFTAGDRRFEVRAADVRYEQDSGAYDDKNIFDRTFKV